MVSRDKPGPFYVESGCCITCGIPVETAPDVFAWADGDDYGGCYIYCQPADGAAVDRVIEVMRLAELNCIRYRDNDSEILRRLDELGLAHLCDRAEDKS